MNTYIATTDVCRLLGLSEPALRHALRRTGAPRPTLHASARLFLWTDDDIRKLREFLALPPAQRGQEATQPPDEKRRPVQEAASESWPEAKPISDSRIVAPRIVDLNGDREQQAPCELWPRVACTNGGAT